MLFLTGEHTVFTLIIPRETSFSPTLRGTVGIWFVPSKSFTRVIFHQDKKETKQNYSPNTEIKCIKN